MRISGLNVWAILGAAVAIYAVGAAIYGFLVPPESWMAASGITQQEMDAVGTSRMIYSPIMPLITAIGMALLFSWANVSGAANGIKWALLIACISALPALWYSWVYGVGNIAETFMDSAHLLVGHIVAGTILGKWR